MHKALNSQLGARTLLPALLLMAPAVFAQLPVLDTTPPTVVITSFANGATITGVTPVTAAATDSGGVAAVQFMLDGRTLGPRDTTAPYTVVGDSRALTDGSHRVSAMAWDVAGNSTTSPEVTVTIANNVARVRIQENDPSVSYSPAVNWQSWSQPGSSGGTMIEASKLGSSATVSFSGTGIAMIGYRCTCGAGYANFFIDGNPVGTMDSQSPYHIPQSEIFTIRGLQAGNHTLTVQVTGEYHRDGETAYVMIDAFDIYK
jgi:hypothetical protein